MKKYRFKIEGNSFEVNILSMENNYAEVEVNGVTYKVEMESRISSSKTPKLVTRESIPSTDSTETLKKTSKPSSPKGTGNIKSPLPGVILKIHKKVGDSVKTGDTLITLEAMKMENEINSDKEGIIKKINFNVGDNVLEGDTLIEIGE